MRIFVGVLFTAIGCVGLVPSARRRSLLLALCSLAYLALGIGLLLRLYELDKALGVIPVLIGSLVLVEGIKARSAKTILAAVALAAAGTAILAGLLTAGTVFCAWMVVYGVWGLVRAIRAGATGGAFWYGGAAAMGIGNLLVLSTAHFAVGFVLSMAGFVAVLVGIALDGWRFAMPGEQQSPPDSGSTLTTEN